jgi:hypothetical protein
MKSNQEYYLLATGYIERITRNNDVIVDLEKSGSRFTVTVRRIDGTIVTRHSTPSLVAAKQERMHILAMITPTSPDKVQLIYREDIHA